MAALVFVGFDALRLAALGIIFAPAILKQTRARETTAETSTAFAAPSTIPIPEKSIAVLPFENFERKQRERFFADGVQDEILTALARVADLKVISRDQVMTYKPGEREPA